MTNYSMSTKRSIWNLFHLLSRFYMFNRHYTLNHIWWELNFVAVNCFKLCDRSLVPEPTFTSCGCNQFIISSDVVPILVLFFPSFSRDDKWLFTSNHDAKVPCGIKVPQDHSKKVIQRHKLYLKIQDGRCRPYWKTGPAHSLEFFFDIYTIMIHVFYIIGGHWSHFCHHFHFLNTF